MTKTFIIDTDTASDDAVALVLALNNPDVEVLAITVVAGNVPMPMGVQNALYTVELCGKSVPVYAGAEQPLEREQVFAHNVHGRDGMGDQGLRLTDRVPAEGDAVDVIIDLARSRPGKITLVTLGPLTNVALALRKAPDIAEKLDRIIMMGGTGDHVGNVTPAAEFNIYVDPLAADEVFCSGARLEMVGWDVSRHDAVLTPHDTARIAALGPLGEFCVKIQAQLVTFCRDVTKVDGIDMPDPITMAYAIDPTLATRTLDTYVRVETKGERTAGMTVVDILGVTGEKPNTKVILAADGARFQAMLDKAVAS